MAGVHAFRYAPCLGYIYAGFEDWCLGLSTGCDLSIVLWRAYKVVSLDLFKVPESGARETDLEMLSFESETKMQITRGRRAPDQAKVAQLKSSLSGGNLAALAQEEEATRKRRRSSADAGYLGVMDEADS